MRAGLGREDFLQGIQYILLQGGDNYRWELYILT
jgi:hypothetical protein